jgi:transcriptional regulator with XRE-family HTH domain
VEILELVEITRGREMAKSGEARRIRLAAGLTLEEVGNACGVSAIGIWRWERGERRPRGTPALKYARLLASLPQPESQTPEVVGAATG